MNTKIEKNNVAGEQRGDDRTALAEQLVKAATWYAKRGYFVFPANREKKPLIYAWPKEATTDGGKISEWWTKWPEACIGVACGPSRLLFLDLDTYAVGGKDAATILKSHLHLGDASYSTGQGGEQYVFRCNDASIRNKTSSLVLNGTTLSHVDIRANGGYAIVPPSVSVFGPYQKISGDHLKNPPPLPDALRRIIVDASARVQYEVGGSIPEGRRHTTLASLAGLLRAKGFNQPDILDALMRANSTRCQPPLGDDEVTAIATDIAAKPAPVVTSACSTVNFDPVVSASSVTMRNIEWLYKPFLPKGKLTVLAGLPKDGKSLVAATIAAALTKGASLPGESSSNRQPMHVLYMSAEDAFDDTLTPRFVAANADLDRVGFVPFITEQTVEGCNISHAILLSNQELIREMLAKYKPGLLVVDPLHCFLGNKVDFYKASETRPVLAALAKLAEEFDCSILLIEHLNKSDRKGTARILGSVDIGAACRSVLMTARNPADPDDRYVCLEVATSQVDKVAVQFKTVGCNVEGPDGCQVETVRVRWGEIQPVTFDEIMNVTVSESKTQQAETILLSLLADGKSVPTKELEAKCSSHWAFNNAKSNLTKRGYRFESEKAGLSGGWSWIMRPPPKEAAA